MVKEPVPSALAWSMASRPAAIRTPPANELLPERYVVPGPARIKPCVPEIIPEKVSGLKSEAFVISMLLVREISAEIVSPALDAI